MVKVFEGVQNHVKELLRKGILVNVTWFKKTNSLIIIATVNNQIAVSISLKFFLSYWNLRAVKWQSNRIYLSTQSFQRATHLRRQFREFLYASVQTIQQYATRKLIIRKKEQNIDLSIGSTVRTINKLLIQGHFMYIH